MTDAHRLETAYRNAGQETYVREISTYVREISPGRYEVIKPRSIQVISHRELCDEIARLTKDFS
jgi:hypothetical protein